MSKPAKISPNGFIYTTIFLFILGICNHAIASTPEAWRKHHQEVIASCIQASGFRNGRAAGEIISFGDEIGYDALVIEGNYPQASMDNQVGKILCLFNRKTRKANISEANQIIFK